MIKIFSMLSVMFALLAGFSACGFKDSETIKDWDTVDTGDTGYEDYPGDTTYGAHYSKFVQIISGTVKNEKGEVLENILVQEYDCYYHDKDCDERMDSADKNGNFNLTFETEKGYLEQNFFFTDLSGKYMNKERRISTRCEIKDSGSAEGGYFSHYDCENDEDEFTMIRKPGNDEQEN